MPNGFIASPTAASAPCAEGHAVTVTLLYEYAPIAADEPAPEVHIACSPAYRIVSVQPAAITLAPARNGRVSFVVTVARMRPHSPASCTLIFNALHDERQLAIAVTP